MHLRKLMIQDAPLMLEWMRDPNVVYYMKANFQSKSIEDCESFIENSWNNADNLHLAITDDNGEYMGTVSLKHITDTTAEFGITVRRCAMGKGYSKYGMEQIIKRGLTDLGLSNIYWCVDPLNQRAIHFYDKNGYLRVNSPKEVEGYSDEEKDRFVWYSISKVAGTENE